jgi:hypothetical protein
MLVAHKPEGNNVISVQLAVETTLLGLLADTTAGAVVFREAQLPVGLGPTTAAVGLGT